jgi:hypothetical protein
LTVLFDIVFGQSLRELISIWLHIFHLVQILLYTIVVSNLIEVVTEHLLFASRQVMFITCDDFVIVFKR